VNHFFHPEAAQEFEDAVHYYRERGGILSDRFASELRTAIQRILAASQRWRVLEEDVRRCPVRVFPYCVLYTIERDYVLIIAVAHVKREPGYWKHRLRPKPPEAP
jgi:plasmid stabilization system protein ParE